MNESVCKEFCLTEYDAFGFDLDHTLAKYNLVNTMNLSYHSVIDYLVHKKGHSEDIRVDVIKHKDFICKGLFIDADKGNIIKLSHKGKILRAFHGTQLLTKEQLIHSYGESLLWDHFHLARRAVQTRDENKKFMFWENYFDVPCLLACAYLVDEQDKQNGGPLDNYQSVIWSGIPASLYNNYVFHAFSENSGYFFPVLKNDPSRYYRPCSEGIKQWLKDLKQQGKCVFLTTSSHIDFAELTASVVLGPDWRSYFDIVSTNAGKPGFFKDEQPFLSLDGMREGDAVCWSDLKEHGVYSRGNHVDLTKFISTHTGVQAPKVVYFGDSLCSDAFPVKTFSDWDVVLVLEEMEAEGYHPDSNTHHYWEPEEKQRKIVRKVNLDVDPEEEAYLLSDTWGSFFYHPEEDPDHNRHMNTFWGELITKYSDIAVPSLEYMAGLPLDHRYPRFDHDDDGNTDGFSPAKPKPLLEL